MKELVCSCSNNLLHAPWTLHELQVFNALLVFDVRDCFCICLGLHRCSWRTVSKQQQSEAAERHESRGGGQASWKFKLNRSVPYLESLWIHALLFLLSQLFIVSYLMFKCLFVVPFALLTKDICFAHQIWPRFTVVWYNPRGRRDQCRECFLVAHQRPNFRKNLSWLHDAAVGGFVVSTWFTQEDKAIKISCSDTTTGVEVNLDTCLFFTVGAETTSGCVQGPKQNSRSDRSHKQIPQTVSFTRKIHKGVCCKRKVVRHNWMVSFSLNKWDVLNTHKTVFSFEVQLPVMKNSSFSHWNQNLHFAVLFVLCQSHGRLRSLDGIEWLVSSRARLRQSFLLHGRTHHVQPTQSPLPPALCGGTTSFFLCFSGRSIESVIWREPCTCCRSFGRTPSAKTVFFSKKHTSALVWRINASAMRPVRCQREIPVAFFRSRENGNRTESCTVIVVVAERPQPPLPTSKPLHHTFVSLLCGCSGLKCSELASVRPLCRLIALVGISLFFFR